MSHRPSLTPSQYTLAEHMLEALESPSRELTSWEKGFVMDIGDQFQRWGNLTERQFEVLERIYAEKTS